MLSTIQAPTLVLYIDARTDLLLERYAKRGGPKQLESAPFADKFRQSYERLFETLSYEVIRIDNSGPFDATVATAAEHLWNVLARG